MNIKKYTKILLIIFLMTGFPIIILYNIFGIPGMVTIKYFLPIVILNNIIAIYINNKFKDV